jgi:imidazolonepropionase-like amidohydrolase
VAAHARSAAAVKLALRHGCQVIYHANFADEEACDLLEAAKAHVFVAPTLGATLATLQHAPDFGRAREAGDRAALEQELAEGIEVAKNLKQRGVRVLPGGDYGFAWNPTGSNARDLQVFVQLLGFTPLEAIVAATRRGGELMQRGHELGQIRPGYLADLLLVDGDPLADIAILQDSRRLLGVMKAGAFHKRANSQQ